MIECEGTLKRGGRGGMGQREPNGEMGKRNRERRLGGVRGSEQCHTKKRVALGRGPPAGCKRRLKRSSNHYLCMYTYINKKNQLVLKGGIYYILHYLFLIKALILLVCASHCRSRFQFIYLTHVICMPTEEKNNW